MYGDECLNQTYCGDHFSIHTNIKTLCSHLKLIQCYVNYNSTIKEYWNSIYVYILKIQNSRKEMNKKEYITYFLQIKHNCSTVINLNIFQKDKFTDVCNSEACLPLKVLIVKQRLLLLINLMYSLRWSRRLSWPQFWKGSIEVGWVSNGPEGP